ncbi:hypothetical protein AKJ55_00585 [candidate division MSBL1 archaeon SCGC-AAA382M17]|uniref:Thioredoxin domain-containing protein n=1 Tax=candidate division MSBL1 archaeon SCGC-AAA382M17 TaxID=1698284 RepID=A0ABR5TJV3_9EURY|nr:hypothetical protein AKJ55_00585 [candidate division MSBL1 archaeon SCGC-AAA382M17]
MFVLLFVVLVAISVVVSFQPSVAAQEENRKVPVGSEAPSFSVETLEGETVSLDEFQGKALVLEFFASWCHFCKDTTPDLKQIRENFSSENFALLSIESDSTVPPENVRDFKSEYGGDWPFAIAPDVASEYGVEGYPTFFVIDPEGYVTFRSDGAVPVDVLSSVVADVLGYQTSPENQTTDLIIDVKVEPENAGGIVASDLKIKKNGAPLFTYRVKAGPGYEFAGWSGEEVPENQENSRTLEIVPTYSTEVTANFVQVGDVPDESGQPSSGILGVSALVSFALGAVIAGCFGVLGSYLVLTTPT